MRKPKDESKYIPSLVAGVRLMNLALEQVLCRPSAKIKWTLKLSMIYPEQEIKKSKAIAIPLGGTFSSGEFKETETEKGEKK